MNEKYFIYDDNRPFTIKSLVPDYIKTEYEMKGKWWLAKFLDGDVMAIPHSKLKNLQYLNVDSFESFYDILV